MIRVADYIANFLAEKGIDQVFTVTGGGAMFLNDAFGKHNVLKCLYNHHEQACAMAAEGYARLSGKVAAVCVTSGPGGTNAITGVLGSWLDSVPMMVFSGQVRYITTVRASGLPLRQLGDQEFDITKVVTPMTKYAYMVTEPREIRYQLENALYLSTEGRPGPVWLDIPHNVQSAMIEPETLPAFIAPMSQPPPIDDALDLILQKLKTSKRPVVMAGTAVRQSHGDFMRLIEKLGVPVVTAFNAHDVIPNAHPLYCGRPGTQGDRAGNFVVQRSDFLLVLGCRLNIRQISYNWEHFAPDAYKVMVDIDMAELLKPILSIDLPILSDVGFFMRKLADKVSKPYACAKWLEWGKDKVARFPVVQPEYWDRPVNPYCFMENLFGVLTENQIIVASNATACVCSFQTAVIKEGQRLFSNGGSAPMGYGLPAAIGACAASQGKSVVCLEGDGSLQMNLQELQTVVHNKLPVKLFVMNNDGYHSIRQTQSNFFGEPLVGLNPESGLGFPSLEKIANAYGIPYQRIDTHEHMSCIIRKAMETDGFTLCEVVLDPTQPFAPKLTSRRLEDGTMYSPPLDDMWPFLDRDVFNDETRFE